MWIATVLGGCRDIRGPYGFAVFQPTLVPCVSADGTPLAIGWVESERRSNHCFDTLDEPPPKPEERHPDYCHVAELLRDPTYGLCTPTTSLQSAHRERLQVAWTLDEADVLEGAVATEADHTTCTVADNDDEDEDGPNVHASLEGSITITEDRGDEATVTFDLDGAWGTVDFEVCR